MFRVQGSCQTVRFRVGKPFDKGKEVTVYQKTLPSLLESLEVIAVLFLCSKSSAASAKRPLEKTIKESMLIF